VTDHQFLSTLTESLNADPFFHHWARDLQVNLCLVCDEQQLTLSLHHGVADENLIAAPKYRMEGTAEMWRQALDTPYCKGFYDIFEGPCFLKTDLPPVLVASHAKAFTRFWKHLRCDCNGQSRRWDGNV